MQGRTLGSFMFRRSIFHRPQIAQLFDRCMLISAAWTQRPAVIAVISGMQGLLAVILLRTGVLPLFLFISCFRCSQSQILL
jgi:hypothetical protein